MSDPTRTVAQRYADLVLGENGPLERFVRDRRDDNRSWRLIERDLLDLTDRQVDLTFETLRNWFPDPEQASA